MNFEDLREKWNKEDTSHVEIPEEIALLKKATHPLNRLCLDMKKEFYMQLAALIILAAVPQIMELRESLHVIYYTAYAMLALVSAYYLKGFYDFYFQLNDFSANTKINLWKIYYEIKLNMERYKSWGFLLLPFSMVWIGLYMYDELLKKGKTFTDINTDNQFVIIMIVLLMTLVFIVATTAWVNYMYGRYVKQIEQILNDIETC